MQCSILASIVFANSCKLRRFNTVDGPTSEPPSASKLGLCQVAHCTPFGVMCTKWWEGAAPAPLSSPVDRASGSIVNLSSISEMEASMVLARSKVGLDECGLLEPIKTRLPAHFCTSCFNANNKPCIDGHSIVLISPSIPGPS